MSGRLKEDRTKNALTLCWRKHPVYMCESIERKKKEGEGKEGVDKVKKKGVYPHGGLPANFFATN